MSKTRTTPTCWACLDAAQDNGEEQCPRHYLVTVITRRNGKVIKVSKRRRDR